MLESRKKTAYRRLAASAHLRETWGCAWPRGLVVGPALSDRPDGTSLLPVQRPAQHVVAHPGRAARARWTIETTIEERKGEAGVDEYEVRYWHSCHRHITLSVMAHAWLASIRQPVGGNPPDPEMGELSVPEVRRHHAVLNFVWPGPAGDELSENRPATAVTEHGALPGPTLVSIETVHRKSGCSTGQDFAGQDPWCQDRSQCEEQR